MRGILIAVIALAIASTAIAQTPCPHPTPTLTAPPDGAKDVTSPVEFRWTAVSGALGYEVWASFDGGEFELLGGTSDTSFVEDVDPETAVEWYVVTNFAECKNQSAHSKFTTAACDSPPAVPVSPPNGATSISSPVTLTWNASDDAVGFRIWISKNGDDFEVLDEPDDTTTTFYLEPGTYDWFVESFFESCISSDSDLARFTIPRAPNCSGAAPALTSPPQGSTSTSLVRFAWNPVPGAIAYAVFAALDDGEVELVDLTTQTSTEAEIGVGHVFWAVVTLFNGCDNTLSQIGEFDIPWDPNCDQNSPLLLSPADGDRDVPVRVDFIWTPVGGATGYKVWASYAPGSAPQLIGTSAVPRLSATVAAGHVEWFVETTFASCPSDFSPSNTFQSSASAVCRVPQAPDVYVDPSAMTGETYFFVWSPGLNTASYEVQEATNANFSDARTISTTDIFVEFSHAVTQPTRYFYRVRSLSSCGLGLGPYSDESSIVILPENTTSEDAEAVSGYGNQSNVVQKVHITGSGGISGKWALGQNFTATVDKPWLTVTPSSGTIPPEGLDLIVTADPKNLPVGTSTGTIRLTTTASDTGTSVPVSVNLVTPVTSNAGNSPPPNALIIPAVAHVQGSGTKFESDIRIANASAQTMRYQLTFTPTLSDGTKVGQQSTIQVDAGETAALNDILKNFYGYAAAGDNISGVLEVRPLATGGNTVPQNVTFASSRTYATGPGGTYGQFIPAIQFSQFIGRSKDPSRPNVISLQQIAQSAKFRTNLGLVEAAGEPASVQVVVFSDHGDRLGTFSIDLKPGEHKQLGSFLAARGLTNVSDGRIEVSVTSPTGKVTAYASVLDNATNDPMLVMPVNPADVSSNRYILAGIGDFDSGAAHWKSDVRLFNASSTPVTATVAYYAQGNAANPQTTAINIAPGEVKPIDNIIQSLFGGRQTAGSILVTTPATSKLIATARTYTDVSGTYGQFIPGLTINDGAMLGGRPLQILQVEQSDQFRTNLGLVELSGNPVTVEISAVTPDSKVSVKTQIPLQANEFRQIGAVLANFGLPTTYNARITLKVVAGTGRVGGYASLIDNKTQDPTYVPAQ